MIRCSKIRNLFILSITATGLLSSSQSFALPGGVTGVGNGGTVITLPDGSVVMSDPFVAPNNDPYQKFSNLNMTVQNEIAILGQLLVRYGAIPDQSAIPDTHFPSGTPNTEMDAVSDARRTKEKYSRTAQSDFVVNIVAADLAHYYFVDTLPSDCIPNEENIVVPLDDGGMVVTPTPVPSAALDPQLAACTFRGGDTYIRQDLYQKMNVRNQTMLILHERLHALAPTDHQNIINITTGAFLALDLYRQQSLVLQNKPNAQFSDFTPLAPGQASILQNMVTSIAEMSYLRDLTPPDPDGAHWLVEPNGGGIYFFNSDADPEALYSDNASITSHSFIGAGSVLDKQGSINDDAIMINSSCYTAMCALDKGSSMIESRVFAGDENAQKFKVELQPTSQMTRSELSVTSPDSSATVTLETSSSLIDSSIQGIQNLDAQPASILEGSVLVVNSSDGTTTTLNLGSGSVTGGINMNTNARNGAIGHPYLVSIPTNQTLQLQMNQTNPFTCQSGNLSVLSSDLSITSLASITGLCQSFQPPKPTL